MEEVRRVHQVRRALGIDARAFLDADWNPHSVALGHAQRYADGILFLETVLETYDSSSPREVLLWTDLSEFHEERAELDQSARAIARARAILGLDKLIGVSVGTAAEAARVDKASADYVGIGSVYATPTKSDAGAPIGVAGLSALAAALAPLPAVAIGGIGAGNAAEVMASGAADGIAVVSAICGAEDPEAAARALRREIAAGRESVANRT